MSGVRDQLVVVGDVHIDRDDPELPAFISFLDRLAPRAADLVFIGDLFNLWIGRAELEQPHHAAVVERLRALRADGTRVHYVEGNRDYRIGPLHDGSTFDRVVTGSLALAHGGRRVLAVHGDLANPRDRQYRAWRRLSRTSAFWTLFNLIPRGSRVRWAEAAEARMRGTNRRFKRAFPEADVRDYAARFVRGADDLVVLGHFHLERRLPLTAGGEAIVLPEWKDGRRVLWVDPAGRVRLAAN